MTLPTERRAYFDARGTFRPFLTFVLVFGLFATSAYFVLGKSLDADVWFSSWQQLAGMVLAFFFGERSGLKGSTSDPEYNSRKPE